MKQDMDTLVTYEPDKSVRQGYFSLWQDMIRELTTSKWLTYQLFLRDMKNTYKQSLGGIFWALIMPFLALGTFVFLNGTGIVSLGEIDAPYPIFAIMGLAFWQVFSTGLVSCTGALTRAGAMVSKINFPRITLVIGAIGQALIGFLAQLVVTVILFFIYKYSPSWVIIFLPLTLVPILLLTLGLGMILSIINGVARDLERIIGAVMPFLLLMTPILYARPQTGMLGLLTRYNPVYYLVTAPRELALEGAIKEPGAYLVSAVLSVIVFSLCWMAFHLSSTRISERI